LITSKLLVVTIGLVLTVGAITPAYAVVGSFFLTGHDPDFHASLGGNAAGAQNLIISAVTFTTDPNFNEFKANGVNKFLFVESNIAVPGGHTVGKNGIVAAGFVEGVDFEQHNASTLDAELDLLGTKYNMIFVASDFGGILTQAELDILNARSGDIINFLNSGGGLVALAESNNGNGLTPNGGHYGFLPFVVSSTGFNQNEVGNTVTLFGASLGLTDADVNGNASHNIFVGTFGLEIVDIDDENPPNILSLAGRGIVDDGGIGDGVVGGELLTIDSTALMLTGLQSSTIWMLPVLAGAAGAGLTAFKLGRK
jgi:hypothetical protein